MINKLDEHLNYIQEIDPITLGTAFAIIGAGNLILFAGRTYHDYLTKAARQCAGLPEKEKAICMTRAKVYATKVEFETLQNGMKKCSQAKKPEKCKSKVIAKLQDIKRNLNGLQDRMKKLE